MMDFVVLEQVGLLVKPLCTGAEITGKGFLVGVTPQMIEKILPLMENFLAAL